MALGASVAVLDVEVGAVVDVVSGVVVVAHPVTARIVKSAHVIVEARRMRIPMVRPRAA